MDIMALVAAFGGGSIGALFGALPTFIITGVIAIVGGIATLAGVADVSVGNIAFGSFLGPHIAFAGGVAGAAFAAKNKKLASGTDILSPLNGLADPVVVCIGGIFGVIGFLLNYLYAGVLALPTDTVALTVFTSGIIVRFAFGSTGLIGKYEGKGAREFISGGSGLVYNIVLGLCVGIAVSFVAASMINSGVTKEAMGIFPVICFGISAFSLFFAQTGFAMPATHHIALPAATAAVASGNPVMGVVFAILGSVLGDFWGKTVNSHCDSHIDPPAGTIFILIFIINAIF